jgi:UDP-glucose 4-epimerase
LRVLITGAAGFLGSWFLDHFVREDGHDLWYSDIRPHPTQLPMDVDDMEAWLSDLDEQVDIAFHFAAPVGGRIRIEHDPMYNADAFRLDSVFFRWAVDHAKLAVYPSSSAIYPVSLQQTGGISLTEGFIGPEQNSWSAPDELYGFSKLAGEFMGWKAATRYGLNVLAIRPFSGYGPLQSADYPVPAIAQRVVRREDPLVVWGGQQRRDFIYITDIVAATMARIEAGVSGFQTMNISSGVGVNFRDVAQLLADAAGYKPTIIGEEGHPVGVLDRVGDNRRMLRYAGRPKVDLIDGLRTVYEYEQSQANGAGLAVPEMIRSVKFGAETAPV